MGAAVPLSRESPTTSTCHFLLQLVVCVADALSPCESCSLASSTAKTLYALLVGTYEEMGESGACTPVSDRGEDYLGICPFHLPPRAQVPEVLLDLAQVMLYHVIGAHMEEK